MLINSNNPDLVLNKAGVLFKGSARLVLVYDAATNENKCSHFSVSIIFSRVDTESTILEFDHGLDLEDIPEAWTKEVKVGLPFIRSQLDHMNPSKVIASIFEEVIMQHAKLNVIDEDADAYILELTIPDIQNPWTRVLKGSIPPFL